MMNSFQEHRKVTPKESALINAYLDGNLSLKGQAELENLISVNENAAKLMGERNQQRENLKALVPNKRLKRDSLQLLKTELREVTNDLFQERKLGLTDRLAKFLDATVIEF